MPVCTVDSIGSIPTPQVIKACGNEVQVKIGDIPQGAINYSALKWRSLPSGSINTYLGPYTSGIIINLTGFGSDDIEIWLEAQTSYGCYKEGPRFQFNASYPCISSSTSNNENCNLTDSWVHNILSETEATQTHYFAILGVSGGEEPYTYLGWDIYKEGVLWGNFNGYSELIIDLDKPPNGYINWKVVCHIIDIEGCILDQEFVFATPFEGSANGSGPDEEPSSASSQSPRDCESTPGGTTILEVPCECNPILEGEALFFETECCDEVAGEALFFETECCNEVAGGSLLLVTECPECAINISTTVRELNQAENSILYEFRAYCEGGTSPYIVSWAFYENNDFGSPPVYTTVGDLINVSLTIGITYGIEITSIAVDCQGYSLGVITPKEISESSTSSSVGTCNIPAPILQRVTVFDTILKSPTQSYYPSGVTTLALWYRTADILVWKKLKEMEYSTEYDHYHPTFGAFEYRFIEEDLGCISPPTFVLVPPDRVSLFQTISNKILYPLLNEYDGFAQGWHYRLQWRQNGVWTFVPENIFKNYNSTYGELLLNTATTYYFRWVSVGSDGRVWPGSTEIFTTNNFVPISSSSIACVINSIPQVEITVLNDTQAQVTVPELSSDIHHWRLEVRVVPGAWVNLVEGVTSGPIIIPIELCSHYEFRWVGVGFLS